LLKAVAADVHMNYLSQNFKNMFHSIQFRS